MKDFAPAGFTAGPCLFKDTMQLASFGQNHFFLGHNAMLINEGMPAVVLEKLKKEIGQNLRGKNIGLLGMTFKANNDDIRESLSFKLKKLLELQGCKVYCHDPYLKEEDFLLIEFFSLDQMDKLDAVILSTPHDLYQKIEIPVQLTYINIWCNQ